MTSLCSPVCCHFPCLPPYLPRKVLLIIGDSNLARLPPYKRHSLQVDSYPGATFRHATSILGKTAVTPTVRKVILAFGLNDRTHMIDQVAIRNLKSALKMAQVAFPHACVLIPEANFSRSLPYAEQDNLRHLNAYIAAHCHSVADLPSNSFSTESDGIHWTRPTASLFLDHRVQALN